MYHVLTSISDIHYDEWWKKMVVGHQIFPKTTHLLLNVRSPRSFLQKEIDRVNWADQVSRTVEDMYICKGHFEVVDEFVELWEVRDFEAAELTPLSTSYLFVEVEEI